MKRAIFCFLILAALSAIPVRASGDYVRIGLTRSLSPGTSFTLSNTSLLVGTSQADGSFQASAELHSNSGFTVRIEGGRIVITGGAGYSFAAGAWARVFPIDSEFVHVGSYRYRGSIEFRPGSGNITVVNVVSMEEYLYGVMPNEMSPGFHIEALRAQAVAARTFTYNAVRGGRHANAGFDLCDTTHCQMYRGATPERDPTTQAVRDTHGLVLFHDGRPILASYFSSSGGATANSEDVWHEARPYLRSVPDPHEHLPLVWSREFTWAQLTQAVNAAGANIGTVRDVTKELCTSGRVLALTFVGTTGSHRVQRETTRTIFSTIGGSLPSRNFRILGADVPISVSVTDGDAQRSVSITDVYVIDSVGNLVRVPVASVYDGLTMRRLVQDAPRPAQATGIQIEGAGWGHGVGMSQRGAYGMARAGFTFQEILLHYYTGVEIRMR